MDNSKNNFLFPLLLMVFGLVGVASFFLLSPRSTDFRWFPFAISISIPIIAIGIGWYVSKKIQPKRSTSLSFNMIAMALLLGVYGYEVATGHSDFNFSSFFIGFIFASLISLFDQYMKDRKTAPYQLKALK